MRLWLARHGDAVSLDESGSDFERRLSELGRRQISQLGQWLKSREEPPDLILHSPLKRAAETAGILRKELDWTIPIGVDDLLSPGLRCEQLLAKLAARSEAVVLCVGHQPDIGRCLQEILGGGRFSVSPGAIAGINFPHVISSGGGQLEWYLDPAWFGM
jgi:phosphohistidine phosphatase